MYKQGEVQWGITYDTSVPDYPYIEGAYLPHSCDAWVIGNRENIKVLIEDLQALLNR